MELSSTRQKFSLIFSFFHAQSDSSQFSWKWNFFKIPKACFYLYNGNLRQFKFQLFGVILGAHHTPQSWCFFQIDEIQQFSLLYYSARKKATAMVFILCNREYPAVRFEYKTA